MNVTVRTVFDPDTDVEVDEREALDLKRQGLLIERPAALRKTAPESEER